MNTAQFILIIGGMSRAPYLQAAELWDDYETYVLADSGTAEAKECFVNTFLRTFTYSRGALILSDYVPYVEADSGSVEAVTCTRNALDKLL
jgi:hypothetical protein